MKVLVVFFSYRSTVRTVAQDIAAELADGHEVTTAEIRPQQPRGYWAWLLRSFVPGWTVPIRPTVSDLRDFDLVFLGFPKWTVNCPPVTGWLRSVRNSPRTRFALFMVYGGFDQDRYLRRFARRLSVRGALVAGTLALKRATILAGTHLGLVKSFCRSLI